MNFNNHVNNVCKRAGRQVSALQRLTGVLDQKSRMAIYQSFVVANCDYCPLVWFFTSRSSISKLEKSRKGLCDLYWKILCHAMTKSHLKQRWVLSGSVQWKKWPPKYSNYWIILALAILKIISKKPETLTIYVIITNKFSQWNLLHPME